MKISGVCRKSFPVFLSLLALTCLIFPQAGLASSEESGGGGVTVTPDGSILIQIVNFLFTIWVLNILLYKPIRNILKQRKEKIDGFELSIETSNRDAKEKDEAFIAGIKEARAKGVNQKNTLMQEASDEEKTIIAEINQKAQTELAQIRETIKKDTEVARKRLQKEVDSFANQITQKILGRTV